MKKIKFGKVFKISYLVYIGILAILIALALFHVNSVLEMYEQEHPQRHLEKAVELLIKEADDGTLWKKENVPTMEAGGFEAEKDPKEAFKKLIKGDVKFSSPKWIDEESCTYNITSDGFTIAEVTLKKQGPAVQKLAIISIQEYELVSYKPVVHKYSLKVPSDVIINTDLFVSVNGKEISAENGKANESNEVIFTFDNIYSKPEIVIKDKDGNKADYKLPDTVNGEIEYDNSFYTLTLPHSIKVDIDGKQVTGEELEDGRNQYKIRLAKKAKVELSDLYGNKLTYQGNSVAFTYYLLKTESDCKITVDGKEVPKEAIKTVDTPEYAPLRDYTENVPEYVNNEIVVLKANAEIKVTDKDGKEIAYTKEQKVQDITKVATNVLESVPEDVAKEVNPLKVLEDWSKFMTCDLDFAPLTKYLIKGSEQYKVAAKYNTSIERNKFINVHTLLRPPFVEESATNFTWITENSFSVDIHFIKQMNVGGKRIDDEMNERCYFVKYDDTNDNKDNPTWKLVGMKEIINDSEQ